MPKMLRTLPLFLLLAACSKQPDVRLKVLIGATTVVAPGAQPIGDSIIVIAGPKIRSVGMRKDIPVPQASDRTDFTGEWIVPVEGSRIAINETANLLILKNPPNGVTPASLSDVSARIKAGEWEVPATRP
ncbi:MAG: hypothetical protein M3N93_00255 [Acidobacteriota bacterium]|nr:hypothetical protein [Acidobacteriota bacterium]